MKREIKVVVMKREKKSVWCSYKSVCDSITPY